MDQAQRVLSASAPAACRAAARSGLPASARPHVWACALGLAGLAKEGLTLRGFRSPSRRDEDVLEVLCEGVEQQRLLLDALICSDVNRMVDSENYFVFEESLRYECTGCCTLLQHFGLSHIIHVVMCPNN